MLKRSLFLSIIFIYLASCLTGCSAIGNKTASMSIIYAATIAISLLLLIGYCAWAFKKDIWYLLLFSSIFIVNCGYFSLSISKTLEEALLANRISYLGSVFLPMTMLMLILNVAKIRYKRWFTTLLIILGLVMFFIAASPGYSTIYYRDVTLNISNGVTTLDKVYGPWHSLYLYYLLAYFSAMILVTCNTVFKHRMASKIQSVILVSAVFVNLIVWLFEQLVHIEFEILSISYIISALFLLCLQILIAETEKTLISEPVAEPIFELPIDHLTDAVHTDPAPMPPASEEVPVSSVPSALTPSDKIEQFTEGIKELTPTEKSIFHAYVSGHTTKEIMARLNIKENTLKFHNKNIYSKLGVSSRKQLIELSKQIEQPE